jgi:Zn-dependent peptidase ImmA (M78 family)
MQGLDDMGRKIPAIVGSMRDYDQGYELATHVRRLLENELQYMDIEALLGELLIPVQEIDLGDSELDGGSICDAQHGPLIFVNRRSRKASAPWGRRMVLAHELCHLLFDREHAISLAIVSGPWAPPTVERRANAFAAELLLPRAAMERRLGSPPLEGQEAQIQQLMDDYEVGITTCTWHMHNRGWDGAD